MSVKGKRNHLKRTVVEVDPKILRLRRKAGWLTAAVLLIVIVINLAVQGVVGGGLTIDLTEEKIMTTGDVTRTLLDNLDSKVELIILDDPVQFLAYNQFMEPLLEEYERYAKGNLTIEYKDPRDFPNIVEELDPDGHLQLQEQQILVRGLKTGRARVLSQTDLLQTKRDEQTGTLVQTGYKAESTLSGAIQYVTAEAVPTIYFSIGHGEADLDVDYQSLKALFLNNRYHVDQLGAPGGAEIPEDARAVFILAPTKDLTEAEVDIYSHYIKNGGSLFVALDYGAGDFDNLNKVLALFNLRVDKDRIAEVNDRLIFNNDPYSILAQAPASRITAEDLSNSTLMLNSRAISEADFPEEWIGVQPIVTTDDQGVLEPGGDKDQQSEPDVQIMAMLSENSGFITHSGMSSAKAVVFGSASAFSDAVLQVLGDSGYNYSLLYNAAGWLTDAEDALGTLLIREKPLTDYRLNTLSNTALTLATLFCVVLLPLALFAVAVATHRRRKFM
ncbi:MAG: Gldg family protein [Fastidiosipilaceae bacterium]|jgi:ABC-2 type transport system permease protein